MVKDVSPEEKLLGLIKRKDKRSAEVHKPSVEVQSKTDAAVVSKADERVSEILKASVLKNK